MQLKYASAANNALDHFITDPIISDWYLKQIMVNVPHEHDKIQNYLRFSKYMPASWSFLSLPSFVALEKPSFPFVVKFNTSSSVGNQTIIIDSERDYKNLYHTVNTLDCNQGLVQQFIQGKEYTVTVLVGKYNWAMLGTACDYKKQFENNQGANTFGLGSISPANLLHDQTFDVINDVVEILRKEFDYRGPLSCQFIVDTANKLWLLEHNARVCDPEFQSMAELVNLSQALEQCSKEEYIVPPVIRPNRAVTIALIHQDWPVAQSKMVDIELVDCKFSVWKNHGQWSNNLYWGSITNSGDKSYAELADEMYAWLAQQNVQPYRYRKDIGQ